MHTRVLRSNAQEALDNAFVTQVGGHTGVFEREGPERFPIRELFGPSAVQAFYAHEETTDKMDEEILKPTRAALSTKSCGCSTGGEGSRWIGLCSWRS